VIERSARLLAPPIKARRARFVSDFPKLELHLKWDVQTLGILDQGNLIMTFVKSLVVATYVVGTVRQRADSPQWESIQPASHCKYKR